MQGLAGPVAELFGVWQLGALHKIESEDVVNAVVRYASGATGVIQAATAFWPGYTERTEFHGTKGTLVLGRDGFEIIPDKKENPINIVARIIGGHPVG